MSILDNLNPIKAVKDGYHALTDAPAKATDLAEDLIKKPAGGAVDMTSKVISSCSAIDETRIKDTFCAVGTVLTDPVKAFTSAVGLTGDAKTVSTAFTALSMLSPVGGISALTMTEVAKGHWLSQDKKISVQQVDKFDEKQTSDLNNVWALYDKQKPNAERTASKENESKTNALQFDASIYVKKQDPLHAEGSISDLTKPKGDATTAVKSHDYTNASGEQVTVRAGNGEIYYGAKKNGETVTEARQTATETTIRHHGATATLNTAEGELRFSNRDLSLLQKNGFAEITIGNHKITKEADGKIHVFGSNGQELQTVELGALVIERGIHLLRRGTNLREQAENTPLPSAVSDPSKPAVNVFMTTTGDMLAQLPDGSTLQRRQEDGNVLLRLAGGKVIMVEGDTKQLLILRDGKFEKLEAGSPEAEQTHAAMADGGVRLEGSDLRFNGGHLNLDSKQMTVQGPDNHQQRIDLSQTTPSAADSKVTVTTDSQTVEANGTNQVRTTDTDGNKSTTNLDTGSVTTPQVTVTPENIIAKQDDGADVVINRLNEVKFDGGKGPTLHRDGSMKLDEQTSTDNKGNVHSGDWHASMGSYSGDRAVAATRATLESNANTAVATAKTNAGTVYSKALSGIVTFSDISALQADLGNVNALINQLAAAGLTGLIAELQNSAASIIETINFATPKAEAHKAATERGVAPEKVSA
jgi:hypothetical protein